MEQREILFYLETWLNKYLDSGVLLTRGRDGYPVAQGWEERCSSNQDWFLCTGGAGGLSMYQDWEKLASTTSVISPPLFNYNLWTFQMLRF